MNAGDSQRAEIVRDPRVYLAAERTFLAWIRTGLALMGFGFVVARFAMLLRELNLNVTDARTASIGAASHVGIGLVLLGIFVNVASIVDYISTIRRLQRGDILNRPSKLAISLSLGLAAAGCFLAVYLLKTQP